MIEVMMTLARLPSGPVELPARARLRPFAPGDRRRWVEIQESTGAYGSVSAEMFDREFGYSDHADRILFVEMKGEPVGISAAWFPEAGMPDSAGRVHWVAVKPSHQGRGLGRALVLATLKRLRALGYESAYLTTGSENEDAIGFYRSLGFEPAPRNENERRFWEGR
ncbi:MAG: GNAT family N-acetyltransferase [Planctomycetota bacterium]|jgi:ribosomal protein S18 acetylase RimI-like enzyme